MRSKGSCVRVAPGAPLKVLAEWQGPFRFKGLSDRPFFCKVKPNEEYEAVLIEPRLSCEVEVDILETELLERCRKGEPEAIETLVQENQARVYRLCLSVLDDPEEAQDAAQESFIAALNALDNYRGDSAFSTWLYAIALNTSRGLLRKRKSRVRLQDTLSQKPEDEATESGSPESQVLRNEQNEMLWQAIKSLDEKHRLPIVLRYFHELNTQEIADILDISVGTVHSRLFHARERLNGDLKRIQQGLGGGAE